MHRGPLPSSRRFDPQALTSLTPFGPASGSGLKGFDPQALTSLTHLALILTAS